MNSINRERLRRVFKAFFWPETIFAFVAMIAFWFTIVHPENILPEDLLPGTANKEKAALYSPEVFNEAASLKPYKLFSEGKVDKAIEQAQILVQKKPHDVIAAICAGNILVQAGQADEGLRLLKRSIALAPQSRYVRIIYANNLANTKHFNTAIDQYKLISQGYPRWSEPHLSMAKIYLATSKPQQALSELAAVLNNEPNNNEAQKLKAIAVAQLSK